jgi:hypothetical protein
MLLLPAMFDFSKRVQELRKEIIQLSVANAISRNNKGCGAVGDRDRREARLRDIQSELADLLTRLKPKS